MPSANTTQARPSEFLRLAREADFEVTGDGRVLSLAQDEEITRRLHRFSQLVSQLVADECAKVCDELALASTYQGADVRRGDYAAAIRAKFGVKA